MLLNAWILDWSLDGSGFYIAKEVEEWAINTSINTKCLVYGCYSGTKDHKKKALLLFSAAVDWPRSIVAKCNVKEVKPIGENLNKALMYYIGICRRHGKGWKDWNIAM